MLLSGKDSMPYGQREVRLTPDRLARQPDLLALAGQNGRSRVEQLRVVAGQTQVALDQNEPARHVHDDAGAVHHVPLTRVAAAVPGLPAGL